MVRVQLGVPILTKYVLGTRREIMIVKIGSIEKDYSAWQTDAPEAYDGFGTFTIYNGSKNRWVLIESTHVGWQTERYASGLHFYKSGEGDVTDGYLERRLWEMFVAGRESLKTVLDK
ncbi:MAG: hypothetical protein NUV65_06935 [Candidatus Roizmanbacteria bacterium]|nr:hypothetical protein [Candidatus Roizmanbacteria bacterium]